ncbi:MAG: hypothetical protein Q7V53_03530 [Caldisericota bacterium]|nr:hypothetical protein [Caldisericota bacterium]
MFKSTVTPITAARAGRLPALADALSVLNLPLSACGSKRLDEVINKAGLAYDARAIWLGYPNLRKAAERLVEMLTSEWPSLSLATDSAAIQAVLTGIVRVKEGFAQHEDTREMIVANFLQGLATVADDITGVTAWGYQQERAMEQFDSTAVSFDTWIRDSDFTEIRFYSAEKLSSNEIEGTRLKILCSVASAKDVGVATRLRK